MRLRAAVIAPRIARVRIRHGPSSQGKLPWQDMGIGRPHAKGAEINKPKYSGDSGAVRERGEARYWSVTLAVVLANASTHYPREASLR